MDPDAVVQCPYDRSHQVRESRLPYHLVRCQQNNPQVSRTLATCPFNARHRVPRALLRAHVASCPDKLPLELPPDPEEDMAKTAHTWQPPPVPGGLGRRAERAGAGGAAPVHPPGHQGGPARPLPQPRPRRAPGGAGAEEAAAGDSGTAPGDSRTAPGDSRTAPGDSGTAPGDSGTPLGAGAVPAGDGGGKPGGRGARGGPPGCQISPEINKK